LFVAAPTGSPNQGKFLLFEALDGVPPANAGPNPVSTCKAAGEWTDVGTWTPGTVSNNARLVDGFDNTLAATSSNIQSAYSINGVTTGALVMCVTPNGTVFVGQDTGGSITTAIADMQDQTVPFNTFFDIMFSRTKLGATIGLERHVLTAGAAAPRIKSQ
jgi:hypothetical protein